MNRYQLSSFLLNCILLWNQITIPSILTGTFIKVPNGLRYIEKITIGDHLIGYNNDKKKYDNVIVTNITISTTKTILIITTNNGDLFATPDQLFYDPVISQWINAKNITPNTTLLDFNGNHCPCINIRTIFVKLTNVYHISTTAPHTFFVYDQELLAHNIAPIFIGLSWLFGGGIEFIGATIGTAIFGTITGIQIYKKHGTSHTKFIISPQIGGTCGGYNPDPNHDENEERKFNTISKSEFFKKIKKDYKYRQDGIYQRKRGSKGIENAEYIQWDNLHKDVEAYGKDRWHLGSIDPKTLKLYKSAVVTRRLSKL